MRGAATTFRHEFDVRKVSYSPVFWERTMARWLIIVVALLTLPGLARAQEEGQAARDFLSGCEDFAAYTITEDIEDLTPERWTDMVACSAYVRGVGDALIIHQGLGLSPFCLPQSAATLEIVLAWTNYLRANPEQLDNYAISSLFNAIQARWPCS
jgi:hypothetical protein